MTDKLVAAEIAGVMFSIEVSVGDRVATDQALCILESMKMHIPVESPVMGTVAEILAAEGDQVAEGQPLFRISV